MSAAAHRIGHPSPLMFHLGAPAAAYLQAAMAAPNAAEPGFPWLPALGPWEGPVPAPVDVLAESGARLRALIEGIEAWQAHPFRRAVTDPPVLWSEGSTRLLDYGQTPDAAAAPGRPVLVVPSLINRAYILDLLPGCSLLRHMAAQGLRPLLLDWGTPGAAEVDFDIDTYIDRRLRPALAIAQVLGGGPPPAVLGYCMGGTIAAGAVLSGAAVSALVTIGAPWDFAAGRGLAADMRVAVRHSGTATVRAGLRGIADAFGLVPVELFQQLFALVDPMQAARKFRRFAALDPDSAAARRFVALEDWLADGVPMAGPAAATLLVDWHLDNVTARGLWPAGAAPRDLPPALIVAGRRDGIAHPQVAGALGRAFPGARSLTPSLGHVGMITGTAAPEAVWAPVVAFLRGQE